MRPQRQRRLPVFCGPWRLVFASAEKRKVAFGFEWALEFTWTDKEMFVLKSYVRFTHGSDSLFLHPLISREQKRPPPICLHNRRNPTSFPIFLGAHRKYRSAVEQKIGP